MNNLTKMNRGYELAIHRKGNTNGQKSCLERCFIILKKMSHFPSNLKTNCKVNYTIFHLLVQQKFSS